LPGDHHPTRTTVSFDTIARPEIEISRDDRRRRNRHGSYAVWLTGLSGSGKSTLARRLERILFQRGCQVFVLDGDILRRGINHRLGFSRQDRDENIRRAAEIAALFVEAGLIVIGAFITPYEAVRDKIKEIISGENLYEIYLRCPLSVCEKRDPKGLYKKARNGLIKNFTGLDDPFEPPRDASLTIDTDRLTESEATAAILNFLLQKGLL